RLGRLGGRRGLLHERAEGGTGDPAADRREHLPHVGQLRGDRLALAGGGGELAVGLALDLLGRLAGLADEPLGLGACAVEQLLRLALGVGLALLGLLLDRGEPLLGRRELLVVLSERAGELGGRLLAPLGERGLELGRGGRGLGALPLEDGLRLLATRGGLAV